MKSAAMSGLCAKAPTRSAQAGAGASRRNAGLHERIGLSRAKGSDRGQGQCERERDARRPPAAPVSEHRRPAQKQQFGDEARVHPHQGDIVAQVAEMGDAAFGARKVAHRGREGCAAEPPPGEPDRGFRIKVVAPASAARPDHVDQAARADRRGSQTSGSAKPGPSSSETNHGHAELSAVQPLGGGVRGKDRAARDQGVAHGGARPP